MSTKPTNRIHNGSEAIPHSIPWQVAFVCKNDVNLFCKFAKIGFPFCGGSIVSQKHVLTAAHCTYMGDVRPKDYAIVAGEHDFEDSQPGTRHSVTCEYYHPLHIFDKNDYRASYDLAIHTVWPVFRFDYKVRPACLPIPSLRKTDLWGKTLKASGWGFFDSYDAVNNVSRVVPNDGRLYEVNLKLSHRSECRVGAHEPNNTHVMPVFGDNDPLLCVEGVPFGGSSCIGDSGGK